MANQRQDIRRALDINLGALAVTGAEHIIRKHPVKVGLNFFGLFLLFAAVGFAPSEQQWEAADNALPSPDALTAERDASRIADTARARFHASRGWFYSCDANNCPALKDISMKADAAWHLVEEKNAAGRKRSKSILGLFSTSGVAETKDLFWRTFAGGQAYAKRATLWDALFAGMRAMGRDEALLNFLIQMFFRLLINVTVGIFSGCIQFIFMVPSIISSYGAGWISATLFFALCACSAISFFVTSAFIIASVGTATAVGLGSVLAIAAETAARDQRARVGGNNNMHGGGRGPRHHVD